MKESQYVLQEEAEVEAATNLVTREMRNKKAAEAFLLQKVVARANEIEIPAASLVRKTASEDA